MVNVLPPVTSGGSSVRPPVLNYPTLEDLDEAIAGLSNTYAPISSLQETITYNGDGTVATVTETGSGAVTTYTYNSDGTAATELRLVNGVTMTRTFNYSGGNLVGVS